MPNLPNDIIFQLMLSDLGDEGLNTLKNVSQVCRAWRAVAMSPVLWARLFDFEELRVKKDVWRTEVLRRTGDCTLHLNGAFNLITPVIQDFFLHEFLVPNMHRIKAIHAFIGPNMTPKLAKDPAWLVLFDQPAPVLEIFSLEFNNPPPAMRKAVLRGKLFFAGHSPALHSFSKNNFLSLTPGYPPILNSVGNLTTFMISESPRTVLAVLRTTPRLRRLFLMHDGWSSLYDPPVNTSAVELPSLELIYKHQEYPDYEYDEIRTGIIAPAGFSIFATFSDKVCIDNPYDVDDDPGLNHEIMDRIVLTFLEYMAGAQPRKLLIRLGGFQICSFTLNTLETSGEELFSDPSRKDFCIGLERDLDPADFLEPVIAAAPDLSSVHEWHIRDFFTTNKFSKNKKINEALRNFFAKFVRDGDALVVDRMSYDWLLEDEVLRPGQVTEVIENEEDEF